MADTPEVKVKKKLKRLCDKYNVIIYNNIQTIMSNAGFPDCTLIRSDGAVCFVECKAEGLGEKALRPSQVLWRDKLLDQQATWFLYNGDNERLEEWLKEYHSQQVK